MAELKTKPTRASVSAYIAERVSEGQRADCRQLMALFKRVTGHAPRMWGPSIVGYARYRYTTPSGRTGEMPVGAFAIRGRELAVYLMDDTAERRRLLDRLGRHRMGKSCLLFRQLADLDVSILERLIVRSMEEAVRTER
jgi:hypothetical protein